MTNLPLVSIIIVNWNGEEVFNDCLETLAKVIYKNFELIVVDNGSIDGSEKLPLNHKKLKDYLLLKNDKNLGFAVANNQGVEKANGKYVLLLNNDTKVTSDFLSKMVNKMEEDSNIGAMQPKIFIMDKKDYLDNAGSFLTNTGFLQHWGFMEKDRAEFDSEREVFSVKGACLLTRKKVIDKIGLFDDSFMSYFEESDFCWRVWLAGWKVVYLPESCIYHKVGFSSKKQNQIFVNYHSFKNRISSLLKNLELKNLFTIFTYHILIIFCLGVYYLLRMQFKKSWMIWQSIFWNLININSILEKRKMIQKMRVKSDDYIFKKIMISLNLKEMIVHFGRVEANFSKK